MVERYDTFLGRFPTVGPVRRPPRSGSSSCGLGWATTGARLTCSGRPRRWWTPRRAGSRLAHLAAGLARGRSLHRQGGARLRVRADVGVVDTNVARVLARIAGHRLGREVQRLRRRRSSRPKVRLGVESGHVRSRGHDVHEPSARLCSLPGCRHAAHGSEAASRSRPRPWLRRMSRAPSHASAALTVRAEGGSSPRYGPVRFRWHRSLR